jgi:hypothetical protein
VQLIKPVKEGAIMTAGTMEEVLENFDFTVVRVGLLNKKEAMADRMFLEDEIAHHLRLRFIHCPISSLLRIMKYGKKGYWSSPNQVALLFIDWDHRPDEYRLKIAEFFDLTEFTQEEVDHLEALMRID